MQVHAGHRLRVGQKGTLVKSPGQLPESEVQRKEQGMPSEFSRGRRLASLPRMLQGTKGPVTLPSSLCLLAASRPPRE